MKHLVKRFLMKKYLKNYYKLYANGKTPTASDICKAIVKDLEIYDPCIVIDSDYDDGGL